ncbi:MAG: hypothetical protein JXB35_13225, partial [Anaerolineae bacterium]|nr:hypothetical protein [Anaerolineae bacterium]
MSAKGRLFRGWMLLTLLSLLAGAPFAEREPTLAASQPAAIPKVASNLGLLLTWHRNGMAAAPDSELARELAKIAETGQVQVSVRFTRVLSFAERRQLEALGVVFERVAGELAHLDRFYGLHVPIDAMERLAAYPLVEWIEAVWQPVTLSPLDLSVTYNAA